MEGEIHDAELPAKMLFLAGATASGKSEIAVELAERISAEIIGVDAFQIYRGLDLLTAKPSVEQRSRVPHHLIDELPADETLDVTRYVRLANASAREILARGKIPLAVGGTGFYFRALMHGLDEMPEPDAALRTELNHLPLAALQAEYRALDPRGAALIDLQNPRRLVRAIEVCRLSGRPFSSFRRDWAVEPNAAAVGFRAVFLQRERDDLQARINARVVAMFRAGVLDEVAALPPDLGTAAQAIGLPEVRACLRKELSEPKAIAAIQQATRQYAKRQLTWFRRQPEFIWRWVEPEATAAEIAEKLAVDWASARS